MISFFPLKRKLMPVILQGTSSECGLCCLAMISSWYGKNTGISEVRRLFDVSNNGMTLRELILVANELELNSRPFRIEIDELKNSLMPCILHWSFNHFVVLEKIGKGKAVILDPAIGRRVINLKELSDNFTGVALELWTKSDFTRKKSNDEISILDFFKGTSGIFHVLCSMFLLSAVIEGLILSIPLGTQFIIDVVFRNNDLSTLHIIIASIIFVLFVRVMLSLFRAWTLMKLRYNLNLYWGVRFFDFLTKLPMNFFEKRHIGDVTSRLTSLNEIQESFTAQMLISLLDCLVLIFLLVLVYNQMPVIFAIQLTIFSLYFLIKIFLFEKIRGKRNESIIHEAKQSSHFIETIKGMAAIKMFSLSNQRRHEWANKVIATANAKTEFFCYELIQQTLAMFILGAGAASVLLVGGHLLEDGVVTAGAFFSCMIYNEMFVSRSIKVLDSIFDFKLISIHTQRLTDIFQAESEVSWESDTKVGVHARKGHVKVSELSYKYSESESEIFKNLSFEVNPGECIAIVGRSGCGKSSLLKVISGLSQATHGEVLIDNYSQFNTGVDKYREKIAYVMQDDVLFSASIADNITCFEKEPNLEWMHFCAIAASIHEEILAFPLKYETMLGDIGNVLSGGQRQRISIARALYKKPSVLIMDEATSHLDVKNEVRINEALKKMSITRIFVAHRPNAILVADRVLDLPSKKFISKDFFSKLY